MAGAALAAAWIYALRSPLLGAIDHLSALAVTLAPQRFFAQGLGGDLDALLADMRAYIHDENPAPPQKPPDLRWTGPWEPAAGVYRRTAEFTSPVAARLPPESATVRVVVVLPSLPPQPQSDEWAFAVPMVLMPQMVGDEGFRLRLTFAAAPLARRHGVGSILLCNAFNGPRRAQGQSSYHLLTAAHLLLQVWAGVEELRALLVAAQAPALALAGSSFGGVVAAMAARRTPVPGVAVCAVALGNSAADAFVHGVLRRSVAADVRGSAALTEALEAMAIAAVTGTESALGRVLFIGGHHDAYVSKRSLGDVHEAFPGAELRMHSGGHATTVLRPGLLVEGVASVLRPGSKL